MTGRQWAWCPGVRVAVQGKPGVVLDDWPTSKVHVLYDDGTDKHVHHRFVRANG